MRLPSGTRVGRWTVQKLSNRQHRQRYLLCRCECGTVRDVQERSLLNGQSKSCGCKRRDEFIERNTVHGLCKEHPVEYRAWNAMVYRCENPACSEYPRYGGRGISVCGRWRKGCDDQGGFECFLADMGFRPSPRHSLDRIDNDGNYEPGNCRWATPSQQAQNKRNTRRYAFRGSRLTAPQIAKLVGIKPTTFHMRVAKYGWSVEEAASLPPGKSREEGL